MVRQAVKDGEPDGSHRVRIAAAYHLPELIAAAKGIEVVDHRNEANIDRLFDLFAPFEWKGEIYRLRIKGKVTKAQGNKAHSMRVDDIVAEKVPLDGKNNAPTTEVQPVNATAPNGEITIRQLFNGINPYSGTSFSISGQVDHQKISSILNGTYEATTEDHLAARSFERSIRQDKDLLREFGGHVPKARPISNLDRKECQIGAAIGSVFQKRVGLFDTGDVVGPGGRYTASLPDQIFFNLKKKSPFHLGVGHELWHALTVEDRTTASRIGSLIEENIDAGRWDSALRKFEQAYGDQTIDEVAANIFGTILVDPRFWQELRTPYATEIANALKALPKNAAYDEANLIKDWTTFVKEVANLLRPKEQNPQQRSLLSDPSGTVEGNESGKPESSFSLTDEKSGSKAQNSNPVSHGKTSVPDHGGKLLAPNGKPSNLSTEQWHLVRTPEFKQWFGDWETEAEDKAWRQTVADYFANPGQRELLKVGRVPAVLRAVGVSDVPMLMPPSVIAKVTGGKHTLTREMVEVTPAALRDPIFIFDSATEADAITVLTEIKHDGRNVLAAIHLDRPAPRKPANVIVSLYEKSPYAVQDWIRQGLLLYANQQKARIYFQSARLQLPREGSKAGSKKLLIESDVVNRTIIPKTVNTAIDENGEPRIFAPES